MVTDLSKVFVDVSVQCFYTDRPRSFVLEQIFEERYKPIILNQNGWMDAISTCCARN
jgi:hypothetical protein